MYLARAQVKEFIFLALTPPPLTIMPYTSRYSTSELDIYSPMVGSARTDYRQAERLHREMMEEKEEEPEEEEEEIVPEVPDDFIGSFPPVQYIYTFCDVSFLFHKLNQLAKRKHQEYQEERMQES